VVNEAESEWVRSGGVEVWQKEKTARVRQHAGGQH